MKDISLQPFLFQPAAMPKVWGVGGIGERWEVSDMDEAPCTIVSGPYAGRTLREAVRSRPVEILGRSIAARGPRLPLLLKTITAAEALSIQVHPGDDYARAVGDSEQGKTEAWVVLNADAGARLILGLRPPADRETFLKALKETTPQQGNAMFKALCSSGAISPEQFERAFSCPLGRLLNIVQVKRGDYVFLPAGALHAICGGLTLYEIQQASDVTYRVYDWHRTDGNGKPRPLHLERALDVIDFSIVPTVANLADSGREATLVDSPHFILEYSGFDGRKPLSVSAEKDTFAIVSAYEGTMEIRAGGGQARLKEGQSALVPAAVAGAAVLIARTRAAALIARPGRLWKD